MSRKEKYNLSVKVVDHIIDPIFTKGLVNKDIIKSMITHVFTSSQVELLINMSLQKTVYEPFYRNCYVVATPKNYWAGDIYEKDIMKDFGLLHKDDRIYGQITNDSSWDDDKFNPYYSQFKVDLFILKKNKAGKWILEIIPEEIASSDLELLPNVDSIKYFKLKNNATR